MRPKRQNDLEVMMATENRCAVRHPAWCDRTRCTANPAATTGAGYRPASAGQHQSAPIPLDLTCAFPLQGDAGETYVTEAVAPWPCSTYLHVRVRDADVSMPAEYAARVLSALNMLTVAAEDERR
jgi:hypothetical protein